jgi:hypothetical protein
MEQEGSKLIFTGIKLKLFCRTLLLSQFKLVLTHTGVGIERICS